jgi:DNA-binding response OmpR family regulator
VRVHIVRNVNPTDAAAVVVLCAEDELRDVITYWFTSVSVRTFATTDGYAANAVAKTDGTRLLITDRTLPPWPGLDTFRQLQSVNPGLSIAFIDDGSPDGVILARLVGANVVLTRPLVRRQVIAALGRPELVQ